MPMCQLAALYTAWHWHIGKLFISGRWIIGCIFLMWGVSLNTIITVARCFTLSFSARSATFPGAQSCFTCTCLTVPHAHVVLLHMCMSYCFTCTSKTTLHTGASYVPLRGGALSMPEKETDGNDKHYLVED